jgi:ribosomal-protein-alanine N-acetyltransferase
MTDPGFIYSSSLFSLRPWKYGDEESLVRNADNMKIWQNVRDRFPHPYDWTDADQWISQMVQQDPATHFAIVVDGNAVGGIGIELKDDIHRRSAEIGYWLGEPYWNRGIISEALNIVTAFAFDRFDLCRIYASVFDWNPASARVLEKAGFSLEGRLKKAVTKDGNTLDELMYAIVR